MLKVLIADDEVKVCRLIKLLVPWDDLGLELVAVVHSGNDALQKISEMRPDIVITDIRMPGLDGIELIEKARELSPWTQFIIISGYRRFDYAYSALKYGIDNYLLKPVNQEQLIEALKSICIKIRDFERECSTGVFSSSTYMEPNQNAITSNSGKSTLESDLASNRTTTNPADDYINRQTETLTTETQQRSKLLMTLDSQMADIRSGLQNFNQRYELDFQPGLMQPLLGKLDISEDLITSTQLHERDALIQRLFTSIKQCFEPSCHDMLLEHEGNYYFVLLNLKEEDQVALRQNLRQWFSSTQHILKEYRIVKMTVGCGQPIKDLAQLHNSYTLAKAGVEHRIYDDLAGRLIEAPYYEYVYMNKNELLTPNRVKMLENTIEVFDQPGIKEWINGLVSDILSHRYLPPSLIYEIVCEISRTAYASFCEISKSSEFDHFDVERIRSRVLNSISVEQIFDQLQDQLSDSMSYLYAGLKKEIIRPVREAKKYITNNYMNQLTLEEVAGQVNLNPAYFSTLFKNETGINFSEFLQSTRLEVAKELLKNSNEKISTISGSVGYQDAKYFSRIFMKEMGLKPSEYRKLYSYL